MHYTVGDIRNIKKYAVGLEKTCADIMDGMPKKRACEKNGISPSMFDTTMRGLRRVNTDTPADSAESAGDKDMIPVWQDRLMADLGIKDDKSLPPDFETTLNLIEENLLSDSERDVIDDYYKRSMTLQQTADDLGVSLSTAQLAYHKAIRRLRRHRDELLSGQAMSAAVHTAADLQEEYSRELGWMQKAISWLSKSGTESDTPIDETDISDDAKAFYRSKGFHTLSDVMKTSPAALFSLITRSAEDADIIPSGASLTDTPITGLDLPRHTISALKWHHIDTLDDFLSLPASDVLHIPHVSAAQVIRIYQYALSLFL